VSFNWPIMLAALLLVPLLAAMYVSLQARRRRVLAAYGDLSLTQMGGESARSGVRPSVRRHLPAILTLAALALLILAMARPHATVTLPVMQGTVVLAFDVSGSMVATDVEPTRLDVAKKVASELVRRQPAGVQIGVVTFSTAGFSAQAPTSDQAEALAAIDRLKVQTGTSIATGIESALKAIDLASGRTGALTPDEPLSLSEPRPGDPTPEPLPPGSDRDAAIVLLTDGENTQNPGPMDAAQAAADKGIRIHAIGVGTTDGATLDLEGFSVRSRLDEETLRGITELTGGRYISAEQTDELESVYSNLAPALVMKEQSTEVTALFAGVGMLILVLGGSLSLFWLGRVP
jgi:Ca-activated chloride channel homolog